MMKRYVLRIAGLILVLLTILSCTVFADFFNDTWYDQNRWERELDTAFTFGDRYAGERTPETSEVDERGHFIHLTPPDDLLKPFVTVTDSINIDRGVVTRRREIPGLKTEKFYFIPLDTYINRNLDLNRDRLWSRQKTELMKKWQRSEDTGIADLDLVVPVGRRFERLVGGTTQINIDGSQRIEFSGRSEYDEGIIATATNTNNKFPSLTMKQEPRFNIRGNIGERLKIDIKQDSQSGSMFGNLEENISIKYEGKENDIVKYIEAGNTSLNLPGATFAGYSGSHQGLFGIRAEAQLGPIEVTTIASQEKGESSTKTFRGSAEESSFEIRDYQYKANTYFFLDFFYREQFALSRDDFSRIYYDPADSVEVFEVYINDGNNLNDTNEATLAYPGVAWPMDMLTGVQDSTEAKRVEGFFHRMDPSKYYISRELGFIQFEQRIDDSWTVGVYMRTKGDPARGIPAKEFGRLEYDSTQPETTKNVFKLIKRKSQRPTDTDTWDLEWKNVYDLGQRNIDLDGLEIKIYLEATDGVSRDKQGSIPFIEILGLDRVDETGDTNSSPDNKVDFNRGLVDRYRGELIFPLLRPFDAPLPPAGIDTELSVKVPEIYDSANQSERVEATRYYLEVKTSQRQSTIQLDAGFAGIIENSETVYLNGRKLTRGTDYRIDYNFGEITFLTDEATSPNAELKIDYQPKGGFQEMQKTLFGIRGEYDLWGDSRMGAVFLFNNESTKDKRVRLGNEPSRNMLFDVDADLNFTPRFLTSAVDMLPGVIANTDSKVRIQAEYARSLPNMNTHGEVYIDDFEGSQDTAMNIMRSNWNYASRPDPSTAAGSRLKSRGRLQWYNPWDRIASKDIWPEKDTATGENTVHVLTLAYGKSDEQGIADNESYAGVTSSFYGSGIDLSRARFLEIWARGSSGELKIDLGSISEDYFPYDNPNGLLDTEDQPIPGLGQGDGILTEEEDTGLDGLFDKLEEGYSSTNRDPAGDNFGYNEDNKNDYSRINGTEGNATDSDRMGIPDTEDINRNGIIDTKNNYYEYTIDFGDSFDPYLVEDTVPKGDPNGWRMFRIPLWNNLEAVEAGTPVLPDSTLIEFARLWITGVDSSYIQIAEMKIVESNWLEQGVFDDDGDQVVVGNEIVRITTKSVHENTDYTSPPGVEGELNRENKIRQNEQSIVLEVENLAPGNAGFIYRTFEKMDFTDYTSLNLYIHGPDDFPPVPVDPDDTSPYEFIARFGADKNNYYEYRAPVYQGWATANNVTIDFATCTEIKLMDEYGFDKVKYAESLLDSLTQTMPDSLAQTVADSIALNVAEILADSLFVRIGDKTYGIKGNPSLNNVRVIQFGLRNNDELESLTTEIWLDELRMDKLRDMDGSASRVAIETDLSGFIQVRGKIQQQSDDFHGMNAKKGSGKSETSWDSNIRINLDRFAPRRWNLNLSVSTDLSESAALPRLKSGSDIILPEDQKEYYRSFSTARSTRISYKKGHDETKTGIEGLITRWAFEKVAIDYDWGKRYTEDPSYGTNDYNNQQLQVRYDVAPKQKGFVVLGWMPELPTSLGRSISNATFNYTPSALNYSYTYNEKNTYTTDIDGIVEEPLNIKTTDDVTNITYKPFNAINYDFKLSRASDLYLKQEVTYREENKVSLTVPEIFYITNKYNYNITYDEDNDPKYSLSSQLGSRTVSFIKSFSVNADLAINRFLEEKISGRPQRRARQTEVDADRPTWGSLFNWLKRDDTAAQDSTAVDNETNDGEEQNSVTRNQATNGNNDGSEDTGGLRSKIAMAIADVISPVSFEYRVDERLNYSGLTSRPRFMARIGQETIQPPDSSSVVSSRNTSDRRETYNSSTRLTLPLDIAIRLTARFNRNEQTTSSVNSLGEGSTFPDISFSMNKVDEKLVILQRLFTNMTVNSSFAIEKSKDFQNYNTRPTSDQYQLKFSPLFSMNAKVLKKYDLSFSVNKTNQENKNLSGDVVSVSITDGIDMVTTVKYRITASQGIPFLEKLKLKSDINLTAEHRKGSSQTERKVGKEKPALIKDDSDGSFTFKADYQFSQKFRGGAEVFIKSTENITKKIHKIREVKIWCEFNF